MCLSNFKAIRKFKVPISWLRCFTRTYGKTSFRILRRGPGEYGQIDWCQCSKAEFRNTNHIIYLYFSKLRMWYIDNLPWNGHEFEIEITMYGPNHTPFRCSEVTWAWRGPKSPATPLFVQTLVQVYNKGNIRAPCYWHFLNGISLWPADSPHKGSVMRNMFPYHDIIMYR